MIGRLPVEIQVKLLGLAPESSLKLVNSHFFVLYNDLFYTKIIETFGEEIVAVLIKVLPWLKQYIKTLDSIRYQSRRLLADRLGLQDDTGLTGYPLHTSYVKDSWKYIYSLLKNKRLFAEYSDYKIDEPINYIFNHYVEINRTYLLSYSKDVWIAPGDYNLNIGLVIKHGNGLGTTKFEIRYEDDNGDTVSQQFYPPTNINDILPKAQFCLLKLGEFSVPTPHTSTGNKLRKVQLVMEEIGLYLKSGFRIYFIDIAQPSALLNDYDLLYYTVKETDYRYFINIPLKNFYKALNHIQSGDGNPSKRMSLTNNQTQNIDTPPYGSGHPTEVTTYDHDIQWLTTTGDEVIGDPEDPESIALYANFYFNNRLGKRYFKFNTIYQRRQFVNRFGDFELDWDKDSEDGSERVCTYDPDSLKWKMPIIGEI
ncbi:hypothetical protein CAAN1_26S01310 [[Candida] anglica]|uniref:F-box domain-containing protein n=1 Tax=[Candida] anglica TaxID=148631 RepID=A0ABP0EM70_9ASCO